MLVGGYAEVAMIVLDTPRPCRFHHYRQTAHLASTIFGVAGTEELLEFGRRIGLEPRWLQRRGEPTEHFDLFDGRIEAAVVAGAELVSSRDFIVRVVRAKRVGATGG